MRGGGGSLFLNWRYDWDKYLDVILRKLVVIIVVAFIVLIVISSRTEPIALVSVLACITSCTHLTVSVNVNVEGDAMMMDGAPNGGDGVS